MFGFGRKKVPVEEAEQPKGFLKGLRERLTRTRKQLGEGLAILVLGRKEIDDQLLEAIETQLLVADVGVATTQRIITELTRRVKRNELANAEALYRALKELMAAILAPCSQPPAITAEKKPFVILMVGVNGSGKTTTIGKLAHQFNAQGKKVMLAAGDTFRAAAIEQLKTWGERNDVPVISQQRGADSASVIFDALQAAKAREADILIADTAGRLHTQTDLMAELKKIKRVVTKLDETAPHEVMLVLDAGTGQNAIQQAKLFHEAVNVTGLVLTKLDGTAKGGVIFAIADLLKLPIRYIGVGEAVEDLRVFDAREFVEALFES